MRHTLIWVLVGLLAACSDNDSGNESATGADSTPRTSSESFCDKSSWIAGTTEMCSGRLVYRDYVYDDYGADAGLISDDPALLNVANRIPGVGPQPSLLAPSAGDVAYPEGAVNTADLIRLELRLDEGDLVAEFELNTAFSPDQTLAALAIDTDNNPETGGGEWSGLGIRSNGWEVLEVFDAADPASNLITGRMPLPEGDTWRVQAVLAQADGQVMNVAFRGANEEVGGIPSLNAGVAYFDGAGGSYWEDRQAAALAAGDISGFYAEVSVDDMREGKTRAASVGPGLHQRVYTSQYTLPPGEGVDLSGVPGRHGDTGAPCEQLFNYLGKYQPYAIYIPDAPGPHELQVVLHGCNANLASKINQPNFQARFGDANNRILISPNGRGPTGFYSDISERDVLDSLADAQANYEIDSERVFVSGYSMGGYGAMRFAALYPHRFAGMVNWVGHTGSILNTPLPGNPLTEFIDPLGPETIGFNGAVGAVGNVIDFLGNLRHVPSVHLYGGADYLVPVTTGLAMQQQLAAVEVPNDFYLHPVAEHLTYIILDDWAKEAAYTQGLTRVDNPSRVTYRYDASLAYPEYDIRHDRAYWISEIESRAEGYADIDLTSLGCGKPMPTYTTGNDIGTDPVPWLRQFRHLGEPESVPGENRLTGAIANVASLSIDSEASCLSAGTTYSITSDGPTTLRFSDGRELTLEEGLNEGSL